MMDQFLWWSGLSFWTIFGILGMLVFADWIMDSVIQNVWSKREFLAFVWERLKASRRARS